MYQGEIYLSIDDLQKLIGSTNRDYARKKHRAMRLEIDKNYGNLTIADFCQLTGDDYAEVFSFLRGYPPPWLSGRSA